MKGEFTAITDRAPQGGYWAIRPEVPGTNGEAPPTPIGRMWLMSARLYRKITNPNGTVAKNSDEPDESLEAMVCKAVPVNMGRRNCNVAT